MNIAVRSERFRMSRIIKMPTPKGFGLLGAVVLGLEFLRGAIL
jgi:hypothetical protein